MQYLYFILFNILYVITLTYAADEILSVDDCKLPKHKPNSEVTGLTRLKALAGEVFEVNDGTTKYQFSICKALNKASQAGAVQNLPKSKFVIGRLNDTDIFAGTKWIFLEYGSGDKRGSSCGSEMRRTNIMIQCASKKSARYIEENASKKKNCFYLFELNHPKACQSHGRSAGSIFCIILFTFILAYLVFGMVFMRCIRGKTGYEMIPNLSFWQKIGNYIADGADFLCRCDRSSPNGLSAGSPREYRPVDNEYSGNQSKVLEEPDEHLLSL